MLPKVAKNSRISTIANGSVARRSHRPHLTGSMARRFPWSGGRSRTLWSIYNLFYRRMEISERDAAGAIPVAGDAPAHRAKPPLMPQRADWRALIVGGDDDCVPPPRPSATDAERLGTLPVS